MTTEGSPFSMRKHCPFFSPLKSWAIPKDRGRGCSEWIVWSLVQNKIDRVKGAMHSSSQAGAMLSKKTQQFPSTWCALGERERRNMCNEKAFRGLTSRHKGTFPPEARGWVGVCSSPELLSEGRLEARTGWGQGPQVSRKPTQ